MKVVLALHDFSVVNNRFNFLLALKEHFPDFKISLFTVPIDKKEDWGASQIRDDLLVDIKKHLDWIQIIPHGLNHNGREFKNCDYNSFQWDILPTIKARFEEDGLPYEKGFCAPHWVWTDDVVKVLDDEGWWGAVDRDKKMSCPKRFYKYNFLLNEPFWESDKEVLKIHGHVYGTKNDLGRCFDNLLKLPIDTKFHFVTDFIEEK